MLLQLISMAGASFRPRSQTFKDAGQQQQHTLIEGETNVRQHLCDLAWRELFVGVLLRRCLGLIFPLVPRRSKNRQQWLQCCHECREFAPTFFIDLLKVLEFFGPTLEDCAKHAGLQVPSSTLVSHPQQINKKMHRLKNVLFVFLLFDFVWVHLSASSISQQRLEHFQLFPACCPTNQRFVNFLEQVTDNM